MIKLGDIRKATQGMSDSAVMELEATATGFAFAFREKPDLDLWRNRRRPVVPEGTLVYRSDPRD